LERDAERTREGILAAAEEAFARKGFDAATMKDIGDAAGLSRSTAAYFFGNKNDLYDAVLARVIARARKAMVGAYGKSRTSADLEMVVATYVSALLDFLARDYAFLRLIQREALGDASRVEKLFGEPVEDALAGFAPAAETAGISPQRLLLDVIALCWYPFAHEHTLLPALGMTPRDPAFLEAHKAHIVALILGLGRPDHPGDDRTARSTEGGHD
jgi:TetR/AcrR family transcriptional regulator